MSWTSFSSYNPQTNLSNKSPFSIKDLATLPTANGVEARAMLHNIMSVTPTLATTQGPLMLKPRHQATEWDFCEQ